MCNEYAREIELGRVIKLFREMETLPPFEWRNGTTPNTLAPQPSIKISDRGFVVRLENRRLTGQMVPWAWKTPQGKPVFNYISENRDFSKSERVLILATSFYEYTTPKDSKIKLKDKHQFTFRGSDWFWIAGIVKEKAFTMLTTSPGPDIEPYHDRQICVLAPGQGQGWLALSQPEGTLLRPVPKGTLSVRTLRRDGEDLVA
jgi:putative SOS response-associated peptidase YedK